MLSFLVTGVCWALVQATVYIPVSSLASFIPLSLLTNLLALLVRVTVNTAHSGRVVCVRFLADGLRLLSLGTDHRLHLWDEVTGRNTLVNFGRIEVLSRMTVRMAVAPMDSGVSVAFVPAASDIVALDVDDGQRLSVLRGHYGRVNCLALSRNTHSLYSGANDRAVLVWTPDTGDVDQSPPGGGSDSEVRRGSGLGRFARRVGGGTADAWSSDEDS